MPKTIQIIGLAGILLGLPPMAAAADPSDAPREAAAGAARDLVAARQANARAQHEGRPSVWMAKSRVTKPRMDDPVPAQRQAGQGAAATK